ncbi:hypothetical protein OIU85_028045 [Salix viminalis]|uniref:Uncharacterized protein n=1 Tax=Salix viminalis TaxID=40686 RepID=A0A9Q0TBN7_SALVM|nr:hypothetical protein OIU85_028045 [Salix viminalis]
MFPLSLLHLGLDCRRARQQYRIHFYTFIRNVSSESGEESRQLSLPALESESTSSPFIPLEQGAENEATIYHRIRLLEGPTSTFNVPPRLHPVITERLVREHFDQAVNVDHFFFKYGTEIELRVLENKGLLETFQSNDSGNPNIARIMEVSPYENIRREADAFIQAKVASVDNPGDALFSSKHIERKLNSFSQELTQHQRQSSIYRKFYKHFTNEDLTSLVWPAFTE